MPADYRPARKYSFSGHPRDTPPANATRYAPPNGSTMNAAVNNVNVPIPHDASFGRLYIHSVSAPGVGETYDYDIIVNGGLTGITVQLAGAAQTVGNDIVNTFEVVAGDEIALRFVSSLNAAVGFHMWSWEVRPH